MLKMKVPPTGTTTSATTCHNPMAGGVSSLKQQQQLPSTIRDFTIPHGSDRNDTTMALKSVSDHHRHHNTRQQPKDCTPLRPPSRRERSQSWEELTDLAIAVSKN
jgi:hypothetical protein